MGTIYTKGDVRINVLPRHQKEKKKKQKKKRKLTSTNYTYMNNLVNNYISY